VSDADWSAVRRVALAGYGVLFVVWCWRDGIPIAHDRVLLWLGAGLLCACIGRSWRSIGHVLIDWVPFAAVLIAYDYSRGAADSVGFATHYRPQLEVDKFLFFGHVPTVWLQEHLYHVVRTFGGGYTVVGKVQWWEVAFSLVYVSHYLASFVLAFVLWIRDRRRFQAYARRFVTLSFAGFVTFAFFPAAPPWLAARDGYLPPTVGRYGRNGLDALHLGVVRDVWDKGSAVINFVAAVPSLHAAFATLLVVTVWRSVPRWARPLLVLYPLAMGLELVATGEHYVVDLLLGAAYALAACWTWDRIERRWEGHRPVSTHSPSSVSTSSVAT
jgi:hypothetical protein